MRVYLREIAGAAYLPMSDCWAPKARRSRLAQELGPLIESLSGRIRGPVGLDIGATTPEGFALAIVGQIHAWLAGRGFSEAILT